MLSFFRSRLSSKLVLGLLALLILAFIATGVERPGFGGFGGPSDAIARVGGEPIAAESVRQRIEQIVRQTQAQDPSASTAGLLAEGGFETVLNQTISAKALEAFARDHGIVAGKRLIDAQIASIPAFQLAGKFDEATFRSVLAQQRLSEPQLRRELTGDVIRRQLLVPVAGGARLPEGMALPYASLLLETREGLIGLVPAAAMGGGVKPTEAEVVAYYARNQTRYVLPERRVLRYALVGPEQVAGGPPTEADIVRFYQANSASYAAVETRRLAQVVLPDQERARAFVAQVKSGTSFADAAKAAGFGSEDTELGAQTRAKFTAVTSPDVAAAAFAAPAGGLSTPARSPFGWHVVRVQSVDDKPARRLAAVHDEIAKQLAKQQADERLADFVAKLQDALDSGSGFDELVRQHKLAAVETPAIVADGRSPDQPDFHAPAVLQPLLHAGFAADPSDRPTVETIGSGQSYALLAVKQVVPAAPTPMARIRRLVDADFARDRADARARAVAAGITAKIAAGLPMERAFAEAKMPPPQRAGGRRADVARAGAQVPPALAFLFTLPAGAVRSLPAPGGQGWLVVHVGKVTPGNARSEPQLLAAARSQLSRVLGEEYAAQFANAAADAVKVKRDEAAIARLKAQLAGAAPAGQ